MIRQVVVDELVITEAAAQASFYADRAGETVSQRFLAEFDAIIRGLAAGRFVGVRHTRVRFRASVLRIYLDRFPFAVAFYVESERVHVVALEALRRKPGYWRSRLRRK